MAVREFKSIMVVLLSLRSKINHLKKIRVAAVSYLNTKPLLFGIKNHPIMDEIELIEDYPSKIAAMLINNEVDVGLIPVAACLKLNQWNIVGTHCIGSDGPVASVCIFSEQPIDEVRKVYLDYQSRTSVNLAKLLLNEYWKLKVEYIDAKGEDFRNEIKGNTAGVIIGDRALEQRTKSKYHYDLGEAWKKHTGLPFVYAAWIANKQLPEDFCKRFDEANETGMHHLDEIIAAHPFPYYNLKKYYTECISYQLDEKKKAGMELFLRKLKENIEIMDAV